MARTLGRYGATCTVQRDRAHLGIPERLCASRGGHVCRWDLAMRAPAQAMVPAIVRRLIRGRLARATSLKHKTTFNIGATKIGIARRPSGPELGDGRTTPARSLDQLGTWLDACAPKEILHGRAGLETPRPESLWEMPHGLRFRAKANTGKATTGQNGLAALRKSKV